MLLAAPGKDMSGRRGNLGSHCPSWYCSMLPPTSSLISGIVARRALRRNNIAIADGEELISFDVERDVRR